MYRKGFTLIELLVVIAVIGILASVILASLGSARKKAADAKMKAELKQVSSALEMYYDSYGTYLVAGSGYLNNGNGWMTYEDPPGGYYFKSVTNKLAELGYLGSGIKNEQNYMIYVCVDAYSQQHYALSATLNNPTTADIAYIQITCNGTGGNGTYPQYGKNYAIGN